MRALIITYDGYDDTEVLYPLYRLWEEGVEVDIASFEKKTVLGKHFFKVEANLLFSEVEPSTYDMFIIPGGKAPEKIRQDENVLNFTRCFFERNIPTGAICHGQQILISAGVLNGRKATCYPGIKDDIVNAGAEYSNSEVVVDRNLVTSRRPEDSHAFMRELIKMIKTNI
jgi:protease I